MWIWVLVLGIIAFVTWYIHHHFKVPKVGSMAMVTGGVKSGKSTFSMALAYKQFKRNLRGVKIRNFFRRLFGKGNYEELPLFYSTIPLSIPHVLLTKELLKREHRFAYKSVIFVDEASLFADSTMVKDYDLNDRLLLFNKLIAHETHGGMVIYNSQSISDVHFSVRRCLSEYFYVHSTFKWLPFLLVVTVREERYSEDGSVISTYGEDVEESLKRVIISKKVWKMFDCYCYSSMTDNLPVEKRVIEDVETLKTDDIVSFKARQLPKAEKKNVLTYEEVGGEKQ